MKLSFSMETVLSKLRPWAGRFGVHSAANARDPAGDSLRELETSLCLAPFLKALGYRGSELHRVEAVPHFQHGMSLSDLRSALVRLGYVTEPHAASPATIDERLMPCLFQDEATGDVIVLLGRTGDGGILVFAKGAYRKLRRESSSMDGCCYFAKPTEGPNPGRDAMPWSSRLLRRFKPHLIQLFWLSALSNVISIAIPLFVMTIYDRVIAHRAIEALPMLLAGVIIAMGFDLYFKTLRSRLLGVMGARIDYLISSEAFGKLVRLPLSYVEGPPVSAQVARLKEFQGVRDLFAGPAASAIADFPFAIISLVAIAIIGGWLVLVPVACVVIFATAGFLGAKWLQGCEQKQGASQSAFTSHVSDATLHHESIKREGSESVWLHRFRLLSADNAMRASDTQDRAAIVESFSQFLNSTAALSVLVVGTMMVLSNDITVGALIATMALTWRILSPAQQLFQTLGRFGRLRNSIRNLDQMMRLPDEHDASIPNLARAPKSGRISFTRVSLKYTREGDPSLMNINLSIPAGKMIAFTGSNGAGKSSILRVVQGLHQPQAGTVTIDGVDIKQLPPKVLRRSIACAPQRMDMFYGTIAQNMRMADPLASDDDLTRALAEVGLLDAVMSMPEQMNTRVGDATTSRLPPGFMRQLTIARALVRSAPILLLDEPESMLDDAGASAVQAMLERIRGTRTILFTSHRPSYIRVADFGVYMRGGMIEYGGKPEGAVERLLGKTADGKAA